MPELHQLIYYAGFLLAIYLCYGLGPIFYVPMMLDLALDVVLSLNLLSGWDIRWLVIGVQVGFFAWVLALAGTVARSVYTLILVIDLGIVVHTLLPQIQTAGSGQEFWNATSTSIILIWQASILMVIISVAVKSTLVARMKGEFVDILSNPRKRFLLPIGAWSAVLVLPEYIPARILDWSLSTRFAVGAHVLVWGWVALEFPHFLAYRRLKREFSRAHEE